MFHRKRSGEDFNAEIEAHLALEADQLSSEGLSEKEAYRNARVAFGSIVASREGFYTRHRNAWVDSLLRDLSFAFRQLSRNPSFGTIVIFTLALGIGASASVFSVADAVLLQALPYPEPQQLMQVWEQSPKGHRSNLAESNFEDFSAQNRSFAHMAAYSSDLSSIAGGSEPARETVAVVSQGFFPTFGVQPSHGRLFTSEEQTRHGVHAVVVSFPFWKRYLRSESDLSTFQLDINGEVYTVIGVMPPAFDFPADTAVWISRELEPTAPSRTAHNWRVVGRLRDGVTLEQAREDLKGIARRIRGQYGTHVDLDNADVVTLSESIVGNVRTSLLTLLGAVVLLLLVACANVAGLLVARTSARAGEFAVRAALGAGRTRLIQQLLIEALVLSSIAGVIGLLMAGAFVRVLPAIQPTDLPRKSAIALNSSVLVFALVLTVLVAVVLALIAASRAGGTDLQDALSSGLRTHSGSNAGKRLRRLLIMSEIAVTLVILVAAGLLAQSFLRLVHTNPGFRSDNVVTLQFSLPLSSFGLDKAALARQTQLLNGLVSRLRTIPGATSVGLAGAIPAAAGDNLADGTFLILNGHAPPANFDVFGEMVQNRSQAGHALYAVSSEGYFQTLGIPLLKGRMFGIQDGADSPHVALINNALARQQWPGQEPVGKQIDFGNMDGDLRPLTIIGIVGDVRVRGLDAPASPVVYVDYMQRGLNGNSTPTVLIRVSSSELGVGSAAEIISRNLLPNIPIKVSTLAAALGDWMAERRFLLLLIGFFAASSLILAAVGLYGVVGFFVTRRTREIGLRMAMGAQRTDVLWLVLSEAAHMTMAGVGIGVIASLAATRLMTSLVFGISASDPVTYLAVSSLLIFVALLASGIPATRAMKLDPAVALRQE